MWNIFGNMEPRNLRLSAYEKWSFKYQTFFEWYQGSKIFTSKKGVLFCGSPGRLRQEKNQYFALKNIGIIFNIFLRIRKKDENEQKVESNFQYFLRKI